MREEDIEFTPCKNVLLGSSKRTAGFFFCLTEQMQRKEGRWQGFVLSIRGVLALPSFLLLCYIPWCNLRSSFRKHFSKHLSLKLLNYVNISGKMHNLQFASSWSYLILKLHCYNVPLKSIYIRTCFAMYQKYRVCFTSISEVSERKCTKQNVKSRTNSFQCKLPLLEQEDQPGQFWGMTLSGSPIAA